MRSTATSITSVVIGICFYTSTALIDLIQRTTAWLPDDINHGRVDNVYWVLVIGGVLNLGYFLVCSWLYKYRNLEDDGHEKDVAVSHSTTLSSWSYKMKSERDREHVICCRYLLVLCNCVKVSSLCSHWKVYMQYFALFLLPLKLVLSACCMHVSMLNIINYRFSLLATI